MTQEEALRYLNDAGLNARICHRTYPWFSPIIPTHKTTSIYGGRPADLSGTTIRVYRYAYNISKLHDGTFDVGLMLGRRGVQGIDFTTVSTLEEAVNVVLTEYRKEGLLP